MKIALVTGGSGGIGTAICRRLAADGYTVAVLFNLNRAAAAALADEIGGIALQCDVSDDAQVKSAVAELGALDRVDVLVNCAGIAQYGLFQLTTAEERERVFAVNVFGAMNCTAAVLPGMISAKRGAIVNISSIWGQVGAACEAVYSASKAALIGFTRALAKELEPSNIRVNCVAPGIIDTQMNARFSRDELEAAGKIGSADEVADAAALLARSEFVSGQVFTVSGCLR